MDQLLQEHARAAITILWALATVLLTVLGGVIALTWSIIRAWMGQEQKSILDRFNAADERVEELERALREFKGQIAERLEALQHGQLELARGNDVAHVEILGKVLLIEQKIPSSELRRLADRLEQLVERLQPEASS